MQWKNPDGSITSGVLIEDGLGNKLTSFGSGGANPVGAASLATTQVSVGAAAVQLVATRTGPAGVGRVAVTLANTSANTIFFGVSAVSTTTGMPLLPNSSMTLNTTAAIYAIAASGTNIIGVTETF